MSEPRTTNAVNALIHFYRAEVGRVTSYLVRLDTTTNWAITTTVLVTTFAIGNPEIPHAALLFAMFFDYIFLHIEARRFRYYLAIRERVILMEENFLRETLRGETDPQWESELLRLLSTQKPPISYAGALGWRLRRTYLWIYGAILIIWVVKLHISAGIEAKATWNLIAAAGVGSIPGLAVWIGVGAVYLFLIGLAIGASVRHPIGGD